MAAVSRGKAGETSAARTANQKADSKFQKKMSSLLSSATKEVDDRFGEMRKLVPKPEVTVKSSIIGKVRLRFASM